MHAKVTALLLGIIVLSVPSMAGGAQSPLRVPAGALLVADSSGHLLTLTKQGKLLSRVPRFHARVQALEIAPDRKHAYVSVYRVDQVPRLYTVALTTGRATRLADAISPSLSPDRTQLAYVTVELRRGIQYRTGLAIRDLRVGQTRVIPFPAQVSMATPPEIVINWSPDGRHVALFDGLATRVVDVSNATAVDSEPEVPGGRALAPVFLDPQTLVVLENCCIGSQSLVAVDLGSGARTPFAQLGSPVENVRRLDARTILVTTALQRLVRISAGHVLVLRTGIVATAG